MLHAGQALEDNLLSKLSDQVVFGPTKNKILIYWPNFRKRSLLSNPERNVRLLGVVSRLVVRSIEMVPTAGRRHLVPLTNILTQDFIIVFAE